jgi:hypothetical protein
MDNKKLMQILLRDAGELEQFIGEIRQAGSVDILDMELLKARISGFRKLLEVACDSADIPNETAVTEKTTSIQGSFPEVQKIPEKEEDKKLKIRKKETAGERIPKSPGSSSISPNPEKEVLKREPAVDIPAQQTVIALEDEVPPIAGSPTLAEKFIAGKSLNDILLEKSKPDNAYADLPLNSLVSGIGTNERFLFTRELFEGNMERFSETVSKLDMLATVQEAAEFLRKNFKWKKNETSMRFIELVKRRFLK